MDKIEPALQSLLTPLTHNLPAPITSLLTSLLGPKCYIQLIHNLQPITHPDCLTLAISKTLGIAIIAASATVKIPQLLKLLNSQSAAGLSFLSYALETAAYTVGLAYNARNGFPFSTYGETALIAVQNVAIAVLILRYSGLGAWAAVFVGVLATAGWALFSESVVDMETLKYLQAGAGVVGVASKVPQIVTVWREGSTGQLSAFAVFNYLAGSLTRIFTTLQEVPDKLILYGFVAGFALNAVLAAQMVYYWNSSHTTSSSPVSAAKKLKANIKNGGKEARAEIPMAVGSGAEVKGKSPSTRRRG